MVGADHRVALAAAMWPLPRPIRPVAARRGGRYSAALGQVTFANFEVTV